MPQGEKRIKYLLAAAFAAACIPGSAWPAKAQVAAPGSLYEFGDSFQDKGYVCGNYGTPLGACTNYRNIPMQLGLISSYRFVPGNDFAVGSTASGPGNLTGMPLLYPYPDYPLGTYPHMFGQIAEFQALGRAIGPDDLVTISYAGNDLRYGLPAGGGANLANSVASYLTADVGNLIALGGRNFVLFGAMPLDRQAVGGHSLAYYYGVADSDVHEYYTALNAALPADLAPFESTSVHLRILDMNTVTDHVLDDPARYGFIPGDCLDVAGCPSAPLAVQNQYAFYRGHPSDSFALLLAKYIQNLLNSAYQVPAQADLAQMSAQSFTSSLIARLNGEHARLAEASGEGAPRPAESRWSFFLGGNYAAGTVKDRANANGMDWRQGDGTAGAEYRPDPNLRLGLALGYIRPVSKLGDEMGTVALNSFQIAGYASLSYPHWFADAVLSRAINRYELSRPGVIDTLSASPDGSSFVASAQGGYLFGPAALQIGPVAGLSYARVSVDPYSESGDIVLAQAVGRQRSNTLTGRAGAQARAPGVNIWGRKLTAFVNVTAARDLLAGSRVITTTGLDPASAVPVYTPVANALETYGRLAGGIEVKLSDRFTLGLNGEGTFARHGGNRHGVDGVIRFSF